MSQMIVEALLSLGDKLSVKTPFASAGFVSANEENGFSAGVKGECDAPDAIIRIAPQLLHVRVFRTFEGIGMRPSELRTKLFEQSSFRSYGCFDLPRQRIELRFKSRMKLDRPIHVQI